jgi:CHASE3 domain sensor protein
MSYGGMAASSKSDRWVRHTHEVLENLQDLRLALENIESGARGFALTGNESYLKFFNENVSNVQEAEKNVGNLTVDNPEQQRQLPELRRLAAQQIEFSQTAINQRRT